MGYTVWISGVNGRPNIIVQTTGVNISCILRSVQNDIDVEIQLNLQIRDNILDGLKSDTDQRTIYSFQRSCSAGREGTTLVFGKTFF